MALDITIGNAPQPDTGFDIVIGDTPGGGGGALLEMVIPTVIDGTQLVAIVVRDDTAYCSSDAWAIEVEDYGAGGIVIDMYSHPVNGLQGDSVSFLSLIEQELVGGLLATRNVDMDQLIDTVGHAAFVDSDEPPAPAVEATSDNNTVICIWVTEDVVDMTAPSGMTAIDTYSSEEIGTRSILIAYAAAGDLVGGEPGAATFSAPSSGRVFTLVLNYLAPPTTVATRGDIRDRIQALVEDILPARLAADRFRHSRDEHAGRFDESCDKNPAGAFRLFDARDEGETEQLDFSSGDVDLESARFIVTIAYPHNHRYGARGAVDREKCMDEDWRKINYAIGMYGVDNFPINTPYYCTPLGATKVIQRGTACDFLVVTMECTFWLDVDA